MPTQTAPQATARPRAPSLAWLDRAPAHPFFADAEIASLESRALTYLGAGVPVHFQGPAGMGKTTLALRVAGRLGRPVGFLTGNSWLTRDDLVGRQVGHSLRRIDDSYIASVRRTESQSRADWEDAVLTAAMEEGHTLVYDEFTRAPPEANATLLSVLEERVLVFTDPAARRAYVEAHPEFRVILTSNPEDYVGVNAAPDALLDRIVTFRLDHLSAEAEAGIVSARTDLDPANAQRLVALVRRLRTAGLPGMPASLRTALLIARLMRAQDIAPVVQDPRFLQICADVLCGRSGRHTADEVIRQIVSAADGIADEVSDSDGRSRGR